MSLPFVSRRAFELVQEQLAASERRHAEALAQHRLELEAARKQSAELTETLCRMKLSGSDPVRYGHEDLPPPKDTDPVKQAIREQMRMYKTPQLPDTGAKGLEEHLREYARDLEAQGKSPAEIAAALGKWESSEDLSAPVEPFIDLPPDGPVS